MKRLTYTVFAALTLTLTSSCGIIDFAYNNAPAFVASEFEDAFDLTDEQSSALQSRLQDFFAWHRKHELLHYTDLLDTAANAAADGISSTEFLELNRQIQAAWRRSISKAIDATADIALTLTPEQIDRFDEYFREKAEKHEDYLDKSPQQRAVYRAERNLDRLETWFGGFDEVLEEKAFARLEQLPDLYSAWIEYRRAQHRALVEVLREPGDAETLRRRLEFVFVDDTTDYGRSFRAAREEYWQAYAAALVDISGWASSVQRQKVVARLQNFARVATRLYDEG